MAPREKSKSHWTDAAQRIPPTSRPSSALNGGALYDGEYSIGPESLGELPFYRRLALVADGHLFAKRKPDVTLFDIELATLQRMVIHDLQHQLVALVKRIRDRQDTGEREMNEAKKLLEDYSTATRNYDFMLIKKAAAKSTGRQDAFRITSEERLGFILMKRAGLVPSQADLELLQGNIDQETDWDSQGRRNILPGDSRGQLLEHMDLMAFYQRASMGLLGGFALIVPMLIMVLKNDLLTTLIVTSASTVIFAGVLAIFGRELKGETVLASVAAYAAVLVVFIGAKS
ncbi:hypothetical protein J7T55_004691 [Diaporthe amygdali]|uniref:uncharacterized protein n=1 Tax=Phomopsis amygdali TaxID=1214568 RepID=UPI0022FDC1A6|nr:uncharacterized protein J7T55_004691 [Diaporthe amygdali]KAJ0114948.1 hypothetical protein J7T55_004691 [Diaporthe amygdali]